MKNTRKATITTLTLLAGIKCFATTFILPWASAFDKPDVPIRKIVKICIPDPLRESGMPEKYVWQPFYMSSGRNSGNPGTMLPFRHFSSIGLNTMHLDKVFDGAYDPEEIYEYNYKKLFLGQIFYYYNTVNDVNNVTENFVSTLDKWAKNPPFNRQDFRDLLLGMYGLQECILRLGSLRLVEHSYAFRTEDNKLTGGWANEDESAPFDMCVSMMAVMKRTRIFKEKFNANNQNIYKLESSSSKAINLAAPSNAYNNNKPPAYYANHFILSDRNLSGSFKLESENRLGVQLDQNHKCDDVEIANLEY